jgi:bacillithiol system protein YtxJ
VSELVSDSTGIVHESPQAIVFHRGKAIWNVSHYDIEVGAMLKAVTELCAE